MKWKEQELAVVTGGGSGLGRALAHGLARQGANVMIVGRREEPLKQTASFAPERIFIQPADLSCQDGRDCGGSPRQPGEGADPQCWHAPTHWPAQ